MSKPPAKRGGRKTARPTIVDIARILSVSPATVSNAISGRRPVDSNTRDRVLKAVGELGYTPNVNARRLRGGRTNTIAIFSSVSFAVAGGRARLGFMMEIAATAAARALEKGISLILVPPAQTATSPFLNLDIDGAIVVEPCENDPDIALLQERGTQVVAIGKPLGTVNVPFVDIDPYRSAELLLSHLARPPASKIALIVGAQPRFTHRRTEAAYHALVEARGQAPIVTQLDESLGEDGGYAAARALLTTHPGIDAMLVSVDAFAAGAVRAARDMGIDVPAQLRIATRYDGFYARESDPPLTALNLHLDQLAEQAVDLLFAHLSGDKSRRSVKGPPASLVARRSSVET